MSEPFVADLHIHSPYAFACSKALTLDNLAQWARRKGIHLLATGDFTHPAWSAELWDRLAPDDDGLYTHDGVRFVPGTEISCVYKQDGPRTAGPPPGSASYVGGIQNLHRPYWPLR